MSAERERARLIRYEALFELAGGINTSRTYAQAAKVFASRLKFVTDVFSWRYLSVEEEGQSPSHRDRQIFIIDGYQGQATISETSLHNLSRVEVQLWEGRKACFIEGEALLEAQATLPKLFQRGDIQQLYAYPIFSETSPQSLFICSKRRQLFNEFDVKFIALACQFFHGKVNQIRNYERTAEVRRRRNSYLAALHATTLDLVSRLDTDELLEALVTQAGKLLGTLHGFLFLTEGTRGAGERTYHFSTGFLNQGEEKQAKPGADMATMVWQTSQPVVVADYDSWPHRSPQSPFGLIRAIVGVPLLQNTNAKEVDVQGASTLSPSVSMGTSRKVVGVLGLAYDTQSVRTFGEEEVDLLMRFADLATITLENARLYTEVQQACERT